MKKTLKHCIQAVATLALTAIIATAAPTAAHADYVTDSTNGVHYDNQLYIFVDSCGSYGAGGTSYIRLDNDGDKVTNVKSSSSNLLAKPVNIEYYSKPNYDSYYNMTGNTVSTPYVYIGCFAKKSGKYTVTFDVTDIAGNLKGTYKITVTTNIPVYKSGIKKVTYAGKEFGEHWPFTSQTSGKLQVSTKKGYKVKSIEVYTYNGKGEWKPKTIKNGATIKLTKKTAYKHDNTYTSKNKKRGNIYAYDYLFPQTYVHITYENTKTKEVLDWAVSLYTINPKSTLMK